MPHDLPIAWQREVVHEFIGFDGNGYQSFVAGSDNLVDWKQLGLAMGLVQRASSILAAA